MMLFTSFPVVFVMVEIAERRFHKSSMHLKNVFNMVVCLQPFLLFYALFRINVPHNSLSLHMLMAFEFAFCRMLRYGVNVFSNTASECDFFLHREVSVSEIRKCDHAVSRSLGKKPKTGFKRWPMKKKFGFLG